MGFQQKLRSGLFASHSAGAIAKSNSRQNREICPQKINAGRYALELLKSIAPCIFMLSGEVYSGKAIADGLVHSFAFAVEYYAFAVIVTAEINIVAYSLDVCVDGRSDNLSVGRY